MIKTRNNCFMIYQLYKIIENTKGKKFLIKEM